jgi:hypothetical protein
MIDTCLLFELLFTFDKKEVGRYKGGLLAMDTKLKRTTEELQSVLKMNTDLNAQVAEYKGKE